MPKSCLVPKNCMVPRNSENHSDGNVFDSHAPARQAYPAPALEASKNEIPPRNPNAANYPGQFPYRRPTNRNPGGNPQRLMPSGMIDACPAFAANLYQNWCREVKLRRQAQVGANPAQIIAKIEATVPTNSRMDALAYSENTENTPHLRSVGQVMGIPNHRLGRTDSGRAWSLLASFAEFKRDGAENYKDFWTRFARCVARLSAHGLAIIESVIPHRPAQALRVPDGKLPILLATLGTFANPTSVDSMKSPTIKMYEADRGKTDPLRL